MKIFRKALTFLAALALGSFAINAAALVPLDKGVTGILSPANGGNGGNNGGPLSGLGGLGSIIPVTAPTSAKIYTSDQISSSQTFYGMTAASTPNPVFGFWGAYNIYEATGAAPGTHVAGNASSPDTPAFWEMFGYSGKGFELRVFNGVPTYLFVDNNFYDVFYSPLLTGTSPGTGDTSTVITLASGASTTNGAYNQYYVAITAGTDIGDVQPICSYVGSTTLQATLCSGSTFAVTPDSTSVYAIQSSARGCPSGNCLRASGGGHEDFVYVQFPSIGWHHIKVYSSQFEGVAIGPNDSLVPEGPQNAVAAIEVGDSFTGCTSGPNSGPCLSTYIATALNAYEINAGSGSTGWASPGTPAKLNFMERICPPDGSGKGASGASYLYALKCTGGGGGCGGTYNLSITYNGSTQTASSIAVAASSSTIQSDLAGLSNVPLSSDIVVGYNGGVNTPIAVEMYNMPGATLTLDTTNVTAYATSFIIPYIGEVAPFIPKDSAGRSLPVKLFVEGSGNDLAGGYTTTQIGNNATATAQCIAQRFPTALAIYTGAVTVGSPASSTVIANNAALRAASGYLNPINGNSNPYVETYPGGLNSGSFLGGTGTGSVASPTANTNDIEVSFTNSGHPTSNGQMYLGNYLGYLGQQIYNGNSR
ncbi:MAG TPA: hypothetical protein VHW09_26745 [Bryobacteraceae bacterium]|jgi:hypothetical protein|nr:hypothetical protein [Bryobacteraceae bacterium]